MRILKNIELKAFALACAEVDSNVSRQLMWYALYDPSRILSVSIKPSDYSTAASFAADYVLTSYLSKWKGFKPFTKIDTKDVAITQWKLSELVCCETNERFRSLARGELVLPREVSSILYIATRKIAKVLGTFSVTQATKWCDWSSGAAATLKRADASLHKKLSNPLAVSASALLAGKSVFLSDPHWRYAHLELNGSGVDSFEIVNHSRFLTVDKNAKTDRCISAEPTLNMFLQKGVGNYIRERLKHFGVDLDSQSRNQELALVAFNRGFATLDLKAASDTLSTELVSSLLPIDWFLWLNDIRTKTTLFPDGSIVKLEKFSSMGNGYTFELESLIFWALSAAVHEYSGFPERDVGVFGDDIIVHSECAQMLIDVLNVCGFAVNAEKSFTSGPFYESCGKHYFEGTDVTPVYQKSVVSSPAELIRAANRVHRWLLWAATDRRRYFLDAIKLYRSAFASLMPKRFKKLPCIPAYSEGDDGFIIESHDLTLKYDRNRGFRYPVYIRTVKISPLDVKYHPFLAAYKYRKPVFSNVSPLGDPAEEEDSWYLFTFRWIAEKSFVS